MIELTTNIPWEYMVYILSVVFHLSTLFMILLYTWESLLCHNTIIANLLHPSPK
jgi:hypothetical protein